MASRMKLPNLKISVDNTQSSDDSDVEVAVSETSSIDGDDSVEDSKPRIKERLEDGEVHEEGEQDVLSIGATEPTERRFLSRSALRQETYGPRIYENKTGNFVTGVDITSEEASEKREKRTQRFGTLSTPKQPITDVDIKNLYKSLGMSTDTLDQDLRGWRTDAILLRGTENMSTKDVFDYFSEYAPKGVEWIDDFSCNVLWQDKLTPARALLKLSSSMEEVGTTERTPETEGPDFHGISPLNREKQKDNPEIVAKSNTSATAETSDSGSKAATSVPETTKGKAAPVIDNLTDEPILNVLMDETMELDYDDNLDLTEEDPIDKALSTWTNFSQNKKVKAEQAKEMDRRKSETQKEKERISQTEKVHQEVVIKEEKDFSGKGGSKNSETSGKSRNIPDFEVQNQTRPVSSRTHEKNSSKVDRSKNKSKVAETSRSSTKKKAEKMETSDESDTESSSSGSSSSSSGSSSSGSSTSSGSDSESGSRSSASSVDTIKAKQRKSRERRDKENEVRKSSRRTAAPPILPQAREKVDIPWPPGWWRLGVPYPRAKYLFLRYAMKADKKLPGAEKRSKYYVKHGNPNFGGIVGLISKSRKRRLRNVDKEDLVPEDHNSLDLVKNEESPEGVHSRLAGRVGIREDFGGSRQKDVEGEVEKPRLKAGRDLRDLLNRDVSAIEHDSADKPEPKNDSDGEMDYGAELERLMGDNAPPAKKRFMRMHADDEEEKIQAKRLLNVKKDTTKWPRGDYIEEEEEEEVEEEEYFEPEESPRPQRKEWVDYDNVEDDDPLNLFGTSKRGPIKNLAVEEEDNDDTVRTFRRDDNSDGRDVRQRLGASDLRAKIRGLKKTSSRTW